MGRLSVLGMYLDHSVVLRNDTSPSIKTQSGSGKPLTESSLHQWSMWLFSLCLCVLWVVRVAKVTQRMLSTNTVQILMCRSVFHSRLWHSEQVQMDTKCTSVTQTEQFLFHSIPLCYFCTQSSVYFSVSCSFLVGNIKCIHDGYIKI